MFMNRNQEMKNAISLAKHVKVIGVSYFEEGYILQIKDYESIVLITIGVLDGIPIEYGFVIFNGDGDAYLVNPNNKEYRATIRRYSRLLF